MRNRFHLNNAAIFAVMWVALSALVLHDIALRHPGSAGGTSVSERVVTKEFVLTDDSGVTRARIGMNDKTSAPSIQLFDAAGAQRAQLRLNKDDVPSLRLYSSEGQLKSVVGFTLNDMQPSYVTFDPNGVGHVENLSRPDAGLATVRDEDLSGGRYVQSYHGSADIYNGPAVVPVNSGLQFYATQQAHASVVAARLQAIQEADHARLEAELARQRAVNDAINAAADRVNSEPSQILR